MRRVVRAQLLRFGRRRALAPAMALAALLGAVATVTVFLAAPRSGPVGPQGGTTLELLAAEGGGTEAFAVAVSFVGFVVFVTFIGLVAGELSGGTYRALLLRQPHRVRVVAGQLVALLAVAAVLLVVAELTAFATALVVGPTRDVPRDAWLDAASGAQALGDLATAFAGVAGWAVFGTALAVVLRSAPVALAVGFAWAGPLENIVVDGWETGLRVFPGQVLRAVIAGGTPELGLAPALATGAVYVLVAGVVAAVVVARRDVTS